MTTENEKTPTTPVGRLSDFDIDRIKPGMPRADLKKAWTAINKIFLNPDWIYETREVEDR